MQIIKFSVYAVSLLIAVDVLWKICADNLVWKAVTSKPKETFPMDSLGSSDYHQLIDLKKFRFTIINKCENSKVMLLVLVHSHAFNFDKRQAIRETWGLNNKIVKTIFMIASIEYQIIQKRLNEENNTYGDLVQGSFVENYRNLTYKHLMVFKYAIYHCPQAKYILKTDDDVFVNMPLMVYFLQMDFFSYGGSKIFACSLMKDSIAIRTQSKWKVTFEEYPDQLYPTHCSGFAILYSSDVVFQLYKKAQHTKYFWIDDVHITGVVAQKLNLTHLDIEQLVLNQKESSNPSQIKKLFLFGGFNLNIVKIQQLWKYVLANDIYISMLHKVNSALDQNK